MGKSGEVISPVLTAKEGGEGMQRVPDHSFGEGVLLNLGS